MNMTVKHTVRRVEGGTFDSDADLVFFQCGQLGLFDEQVGAPLDDSCGSLRSHVGLCEMWLIPRLSLEEHTAIN